MHVHTYMYTCTLLACANYSSIHCPTQALWGKSFRTPVIIISVCKNATKGIVETGDVFQCIHWMDLQINLIILIHSKFVAKLSNFQWLLREIASCSNLEQLSKERINTVELLKLLFGWKIQLRDWQMDCTEVSWHPSVGWKWFLLLASLSQFPLQYLITRWQALLQTLVGRFPESISMKTENASFINVTMNSSQLPTALIRATCSITTIKIKLTLNKLAAQRRV